MPVCLRQLHKLPIITKHGNPACATHSEVETSLFLLTPNVWLSVQMVLKCADIGHLAASPRTHRRWAFQLEEEFFRQVLAASMCPLQPPDPPPPSPPLLPPVTHCSHSCMLHGQRHRPAQFRHPLPHAIVNKSLSVRICTHSDTLCSPPRRQCTHSCVLGQCWLASLSNSVQSQDCGHEAN